jgi:hypothetical protein
MGGTNGGLGASTIPRSLAIKFDFFNNGGEGPDSTGLYINGATPTVPAINLRNTGINLLSGDSMAVHLTYDGSNLAMTITDQVTAATWSCVWHVNIPQIVGGNTAYVGFTGSTEVLTASQKIVTWTYVATTPGQASSTVTPVINPATGSYSNPQVVTITEPTAGATIYYTTDGTTPTTFSNVYSAPFTVSASQKIQAMALVPGGAVSGLASATLAITTGATGAVPNYTSANGFNYGSLIFNGTVLAAYPHQLNGQTVTTKSLQLTDGGLNEARSAFFATTVNIQEFASDFDFQLSNAVSQGFTFVIQHEGLNAVGTTLGYGGPGSLIANSVALGFSIDNSTGAPPNSIGLYLNGASSAALTTNLTASGIVLNTGHVIHAHLAYNGTNLLVTLTDATTAASITVVYPVNIPLTVGGSTAYVGFTGSTSNTATAGQSILDWTYSVLNLPTLYVEVTNSTMVAGSPSLPAFTSSVFGLLYGDALG